MSPGRDSRENAWSERAGSSIGAAPAMNAAAANVTKVNSAIATPEDGTCPVLGHRSTASLSSRSNLATEFNFATCPTWVLLLSTQERLLVARNAVARGERKHEYDRSFARAVIRVQT